MDHARPLVSYTRGRRRRQREDKQGVGIIRAVICNAVWTNARAHAADERVQPICKLCGAAADTLHHRLWYCPATEQDREAMGDKQLVRKARAAGAGDKFYTTGVFPHPADTWPAPAAEPLVDVTRHDGGETDGPLYFSGHFYGDGSCSTHIIPELRRAGIAMVVKDGGGRDVATVSTPLWRELPQTPQAAEYATFAMATQYLGGPRSSTAIASM